MSEPPWLTIARQELGVKEFPGRASNPRVEEYQRSADGREDDEVPWCSSFVNWCIEQAGLKGTNSGAARSWMRESVTSPLVKPRMGCIVVLWRESKTGYKGHVGFFDSIDDKKQIRMLGGNQGNAVTIRSFPMGRVLGFRWPLGFPL